MTRPPDFETTLACHTAARIAREAILFYVLGPLIDHYTEPRVVGTKHLEDLPQPVIFAANHQSHLDTPILLRALPAAFRVHTVVLAAADYFYRNRVKALAVTLVAGTVPIERRGLDKRSADRMNWLIHEAWNLLVYPEGTRSRDGRLGRFRSGVAFLAVSHGIPVVPMYVHGTYEAMPQGTRWPRRHPVVVHFAPALFPGPEEDHRALTERLQATVERMRDAAADLHGEGPRPER